MIEAKDVKVGMYVLEYCIKGNSIETYQLDDFHILKVVHIENGTRYMQEIFPDLWRSPGYIHSLPFLDSEYWTYTEMKEQEVLGYIL